MGNIVDTAERRIQITILTATDIIISPRIELVVKSINASYRRDASSVMAVSEHGNV